MLGDHYPSPFGHEVAGTIVKVGAHVPEFKPGMRVVAANSAPCDNCAYCLSGRPNLCDHMKLLNGAYAEYIRIPEQIVKHNLYEIPDHLSFQAAALSEPLACAVHAFERLGIQKDQSAIILGCGIMGLLFSEVARHRGTHLIAVGRNEEKLSRARRFGLEKVIDVRGLADPIHTIRSFTPEGIGADYVVEAIGKPETWEQAFQLVRKGGTVCLFGGCKKGSTFSLDTHQIHYQEVAVRGVFHHTPEHFATALRYLAENIVQSKHYITETVQLKDLPEYFSETAHGSPFKAAVTP